MRKIAVLIGLIFLVLTLMSNISEVNETKPDYFIDIYDNGDGMIVLQDLRSGESYKIPFDSLEEKIIKLNE